MAKYKRTKKHQMNLTLAIQKAMQSKEVRNKISKSRIEKGLGKGKKNGMFGKHRSIKLKKKLSQLKKGVPLSKEHKKAVLAGIKKRMANYKYVEKGITSDGYVYIVKPNHPNTRKSNGNILEHRYVMSTYLKRPLKKNEVVHHINLIKTDNRIENLMLFKNMAEHNKFHIYIYEFILESLGEEFIQIYKEWFNNYKEVK